MLTRTGASKLQRYRAAAGFWGRRASVLILVVVLLVLVALMGTAYISTSRIDRHASQQNIANTQIDLLVEGVVSITESTIADDVFGTVGGVKTYRPPSAPPPYENYDSPATDIWLAERIPVRVSPTVASPRWDFISAPLMSGAFESPYTAGGGAPTTYTSRTAMRPAWISVSSIGGTTVYPALSSGIMTYLAADADGDGIADAGLFRLPVSPIDGVTYYAATRVIDNAAAINVNTAWKRGNNPAANPTNWLKDDNACFTSNIALRELLVSWNGTGSAEMDYLTNRRLGYSAGGAVQTANLTPVGDNGKSRNGPDFVFTTEGDALFMQLGRRIDNPGYNTTTRKYKPFGFDDAMSLAYRFCLVNPDASKSPLEALLASAPTGNGKDSIYRGRPTQPYDADAQDAWFAANFDFGQGTAMPIRSILTTRNPVSNRIYAHPIMQMSGATGTLPDYILAPDGGKEKDNAGFIPLSRIWPYTDVAARRVSLNTANFEELWRGFWNVMCADDGSPNAALDATIFRSSLRDPDTGSPLTLPLVDRMLIRAAQAAVNVIDMRDTDNEVTAASFEVDLSGSEQKGKGKKGYAVRVFGVERQPFITEVFVSTCTNVQGDLANPNPSGYFAIELYNPFNQNINLKGWRIFAIPRTGADYDKKQNFEPIYEFVADTVMQPDSYLMLENFDRYSKSSNPSSTGAAAGAAAGGTQGKDKHEPATKCPQPVAAVDDANNKNEKVSYLYVPALAGLRDMEMLISRPCEVLGKGNGTGNNKINNGTSNGKNNQPDDMAPVDQFDFTGLKAPSAANAEYWHYVRGHGPGREWQCVNAGGYDSSKTSRRHDGIDHLALPSLSDDTWSVGKVYLGGASAIAGESVKPFFATDTNVSLPLSLEKNPALNINNNNRFPFGMFANVGRARNVPFVGAISIGARQDNGNSKWSYPVLFNSFSMEAAFATPTGYPCPTFAAPEHQSWASDLWDYFTAVHNAHDDYLPNVAPGEYPNILPLPQKVSNAGGMANTNEHTLPTHGLININTAPWPVLAALPMVRDANANASLAKAILAHRLTTPFEHLGQLNTVTDPGGTINGFQNAWGTWTVSSTETQHAMVNRLSNLITTRSDSFTCYIVVQGWRNVGTTEPQLVTERRVAFIADRSNLSDANRSMKVTRIPAQ